MGPEASETRTLLLDAAEALMRESGYGAVTSRRIAGKVGVKGALIHYYFRTMDDLFTALWRRYADRRIAQHSEAVASLQPLRAFWEFSHDGADVTFTIEFLALARSRPAIRAEIARTGELIRGMQTKRLSQCLDEYEVGPPEFISAVIGGIARILVMEHAIGMTRSHATILQHIEEWLTRLEGKRKATPTTMRLRSANGSDKFI
jgi:AcrR family transcriptional regulator